MPKIMKDSQTAPGIKKYLVVFFIFFLFFSYLTAVYFIYSSQLKEIISIEKISKKYSDSEKILIKIL